MLGDRRIAVAVIVAVLAAVGLGRSYVRPPTTPPDEPDVSAQQPHRAQPTGAPMTPAPAVARAVPATPPAQPAAMPPGTASPAATVSAEEALVGGQAQVVALGRRAADDYRARAQYPPWSRPFNDEGEDPILRDRLVSPITATGPDGADPTLVVFPDQVSFEAPDPVLLYAYLSVNDSRVPAAAVSGVIMSEDLQPLATLEYVDDG